MNKNHKIAKGGHPLVNKLNVKLSFKYRGITEKESVSGIDSGLWNTCNILMYTILINRKKRKRKKYTTYNFLEHLRHGEMFYRINEHSLTDY